MVVPAIGEIVGVPNHNNPGQSLVSGGRIPRPKPVTVPYFSLFLRSYAACYAAQRGGITLGAIKRCL